MRTKRDTAAQTRERLMEAAVNTLQQSGIGGLTLDAVAHQAGVSKGGLLHHFANKDALVEAILRTLLDAFEARVKSYHAAEQPTAGRWLRAYIHATFDSDDELPMEVIALLSSALVENAGLMDLLRSDVEMWNTLLASDGIARSRATVLRMAADAYWTERLVGTLLSEANGQEALRNELLQMVMGS